MNPMSPPLDGDPEQLVQMLVDGKRPSQRLTNYVLAKPEELVRPILAFNIGQNEYPYEREELITFVRINERYIRSGGLEYLKTVGLEFGERPNAQEQFGRMLEMLETFRSQIALILESKHDILDVRSEVLMRLITFLANQVKQRYRTYANAVRYLNQPKYRARIGPATLRPMFKEFAGGIGTPAQEIAEKLLLIAEAALLCGDSAIVVGARELLQCVQLEGVEASSIRADLLRRCSTAHESDVDAEGQLLLAGVRKSRHPKASDADF